MPGIMTTRETCDERSCRIVIGCFDDVSVIWNAGRSCDDASSTIAIGRGLGRAPSKRGRWKPGLRQVVGERVVPRHHVVQVTSSTGWLSETACRGASRNKLLAVGKVRMNSRYLIRAWIGDCSSASSASPRFWSE